MKIEIPTIVTHEVDTLHVDAAVRYDDEDMPYDFPGRVDDRWVIDIDVDAGKIRNWPGPAFTLCMKVCDEGVYSLIANGAVVVKRDGYVPQCIGDGDYIEIEFLADGTIMKGWDPYFDDMTGFVDE